MLDFLKRNKKQQQLPTRDILEAYKKVDELGVIENLPAGTVVRAVQPKTSGHKWAAQFNSTNGIRRGVTYYGATIHEAIQEMLRHDELAAAKFHDNDRNTFQDNRAGGTSEGIRVIGKAKVESGR